MSVQRTETARSVAEWFTAADAAMQRFFLDHPEERARFLEGTKELFQQAFRSTYGFPCPFKPAAGDEAELERRARVSFLLGQYKDYVRHCNEHNLQIVKQDMFLVQLLDVVGLQVGADNKRTSFKIGDNDTA